MNIWHDDGVTVRRTDEVIQHLTALLISETSQTLTDIQPALQEWGIQAIHFTARLLDTASPVIVKVGVSPAELFYVRQLGRREPELVPAVYASGERLGEIDICWAAFEFIPYGPFGPLWQGHEFDLMIEAGVKFQRLAQEIEPPDLARQTSEAFRRALDRGAERKAPGPVDRVLKAFDPQWDWLAGTCPIEICHGDFHLGNALSRHPAPHGPAVLIDFSPVYQPWCFDAAYLQALTVGDRNRKNRSNLVKRMARLREGFGLSTIEDDDLDRLEKLTVGWFALTQWQPARQSYLPDYTTETAHLIQQCAALC
jgi:Ser/Thr protein kinase RdoA (MazF antagonist)